VASVGLFLVSLGKWSDPIIDSGSEWMYADALARGQLLYRDVVYWFGPFTPYFQAIFLRIFGSSFVSLVISGIVGSVFTLVALYWALRRVSGRREAFLCGPDALAHRLAAELQRAGVPGGRIHFESFTS